MPVLSQPELDLQIREWPDQDIPAEMRQIIAYLWRHANGRANAISAPVIANALGIGDPLGRYVRNLISMYQADLPFIVVGLSGKGYYITDTPIDMDEYDRSMLATLKSIASRIRAFRRNCKKCGHPRIGGHYT